MFLVARGIGVCGRGPRLSAVQGCTYSSKTRVTEFHKSVVTSIPPLCLYLSRYACLLFTHIYAYFSSKANQHCLEYALGYVNDF